jgi:acylphosphatase
LIARLCRVTGRVQGVFYRASTRARAESLGLVGHARNLPDGSVEVLVCGDDAAVDALCAWLWQGSPASHVTDVQVEERAPESITPWPQAFHAR